MIAQVDEALCRLLAPHLPAGTEIRLDPPKPTWQTEAQVRSVELFLFALQNARNTDSPAGGRDAGAGQVGGPATGVTPRAGGLNRRRCILSYLVTARAGLVRDEHALLDAALHAVTAADEIPKTFLPAHSNGCLPVEIAISDADPTSLWTSLGMPVRAGFVVSVTAGLTASKPRRRAVKSRA
ncbi:MAG TPA: Pvc16 family protein [Amycolatopsis sp.]|nr:Pvc16 family protein [Amycolatopsis sp.]